MHVRRRLSAVVGIIVLVGASWACEQAGKARMIDAHQRRRNCWVEETTANPICLRDRHLASEDADWCQSAVEACRAKGFYRSVDAAEASWHQWWMAVTVLRVLALLASVALACRLGWHGLKRLRAPWARPDEAS